MALLGKVQTRNFETAPYHVLMVRCLLCGHNSEHVMPLPLANKSGNHVIPECACYDSGMNFIQPVRTVADD